MTRLPDNQLDLTAVSAANQQLWEKHPELRGRQLTTEPADTAYRKEWMRSYFASRSEADTPPPPSVEPAPVDPPLPVVVGAPSPCPGVASMTHEQKMEEAIKRAPITDAIRKQLGDIPTLIGVMVATTGALIALAATGYGAIAEAVGAVLLVTGAAIGGYDVGGGIMSLIDFYKQTQCDTAQTSADLDRAGQNFADGVAKMGVGGLTLLLSFAGAEQVPGVGDVPASMVEDLKGGGSFLMSEEQYIIYVKGAPTIGRPDGQFITSARQMDQLIGETGGDPVLLGKKLGLPWQPGTRLVRIDIKDPLSFNPRLPKPSMSGANPLFKPGGVTSGGVSEVTIDPVPASSAEAKPLKQP